MRIRKRFLSLSAATTTSPLPSDLHAGDHQHPLIVVQHQQEEQLHQNKINPYSHDDDTRLSKFSDHSHRPSPPSSAHETTQIGLQPSGAATHLNKTKEYLESEKKIKDIIKIDETCRKESILSCEEANSHDLVSKGRLEGDMIPIKKRKGSIGKNVNLDFQEDNEITEGTREPKSKKNKNNEKKGNVIMEGSRCSRVNGRGWRCGQLTLVGYSLCEHHLGKGRLRSMTTNVRGRALKEQEANKKKDKEVEIPSLENHDIEDDENDDEDEDEFKDWEVESLSSSIEGTKKLGKKKKKTKFGVVKARSLSSLLSQIDS